MSVLPTLIIFLINPLKKSAHKANSLTSKFCSNNPKHTTMANKKVMVKMSVNLHITYTNQLTLNIKNVQTLLKDVQRQARKSFKRIDLV